MKRFVNSYSVVFLLLGISVVFTLPFLLSTGIPHTHDGQMHIARIAAYSQALFEGQFPVRWAGYLNHGFGTPVFIFYYPLPYLAGSVLHWFGLSYTDAFKLLLVVSFVLSPVSFYLYMRSMFSRSVAFSASLVYGLAPYHFLDLLVRGAIGELFAFVFIPIVLYSIELLKKNRRLLGFMLGTCSYSLLILSHNAFGLLFTGFFVLYALSSLRGIKQWVSFCALILISIGITAHFWMPAMWEQRYTHANMFISDTYKTSFVSLDQLIYSPWGFGTKVQETGGLSPQIGPLHVFILLISLIFLFRRHVPLRVRVLGLSMTVVGVFLSLSLSSFLWERITFLQKFEFAWRMSGVVSMGAALLTPLLFFHAKAERLLLIGLFVLLGLSFTYTTHPRMEVYHDDYYLQYAHSTDFGAVTPIWTAGDPVKRPASGVEVIGGQASVSNFVKKGTLQTFSVDAKTESILLVNTLYYPGWEVFVDGIPTAIQFQDPSNRGLMTFRVSPGLKNISVQFRETKFRQVANGISFLCLVIYAMVVVGMKKRSVEALKTQQTA